MLRPLSAIRPHNILGDEKNYSKLLESDVKEEAEAYKKFIELYEIKVLILSEIRGIWEKGRLVSMESQFSRIAKLNKDIIKALGILTVDIKRDDLITKSFFYKMLKTRMGNKPRELSPDDREAYYKKFKYQISRINENLVYVSGLCRRQNDYIGNKKNWELGDEGKHAPFSSLVHEETNKVIELKNDIFVVLRNLQAVSQSLKQEDFVRKLKRLKLSYAHPFSKDLKKFYYGPFMKRFPPDEREPYQAINEMMMKGRYIVVVAKIDGEIVGGVVYSIFPYGSGSNSGTFGVIYWICVLEDMRERAFLIPAYMFVGSKLVGESIKDMVTRCSFSRRSIDGIFVEMDDPKKMTSTDIDAAAMPPEERLKFWIRNGLRKVFQGYIQLTVDPAVYADKLSLFVRPITAKWNSGINGNDLHGVLLSLAKYGCNYEERFLENYPPWLEMMRNAGEKEFYPLE